MSKQINITIVGGGFGGVKAALELAENEKNQITLVTDKPDFQYYPALFSTATGYRHLQSWVPLGLIFAGKPNIRVILDTVTKIDPDTKTLTLASGETHEYKKMHHGARHGDDILRHRRPRYVRVRHKISRRNQTS